MTRSDSEKEETVILTKEAGGVNASATTLSELIVLEF